MKKLYFGLILIFIIFLFGCSKNVEETTSSGGGISKSVDVKVNVEDSKVTDNPEVKKEGKKEQFELTTDKKRYNTGNSLKLSFVNNFDKDVKVRLSEGINLIKVEGDSKVQYGATKLLCECDKQCEPKMNNYDVPAGGNLVIPLAFNLQIESCAKGQKVSRDLEKGVYKTKIEYLNRGETDIWREIESNIFIVS